MGLTLILLTHLVFFCMAVFSRENITTKQRAVWAITSLVFNFIGYLVGLNYINDKKQQLKRAQINN